MSAQPRRRMRRRAQLRWFAYRNAYTLLVFVAIAVVVYALLVWEVNNGH